MKIPAFFVCLPMAFMWAGSNAVAGSMDGTGILCEIIRHKTLSGGMTGYYLNNDKVDMIHIRKKDNKSEKKIINLN
jgi:hypothetical protein